MTQTRKPGPVAAAARALLAGAVALACSLGAAAAKEDGARSTLGVVALGLNDDFGTGDILDRWRTGAVSAHLFHGTGWRESGAVAPGEVLELRFRGEIMSPESIDNPEPGDRPYAASLSFGVHTYGRSGPLEYRFGADLVFTGPQTGLSELQRKLHKAMLLPDPSAAADEQIGDAAYLTFSGEAVRAMPFGADASLRPFAAARAGDETLARVGLDLVGGSLASGGLLLRDVSTGLLFEGTRGARDGFGWALGLDVAAVADSVYLPDDGRFPGPETGRGRLRGSVVWAGDTWSASGGLTWLGEEFEGQRAGQLVGAVGLTLAF